MVPRRLLMVLVVAIAALLQVSIVQRIEFGDASPDLLVLVIVALALMTNSVDGAVAGFSAGMLVSLFAALPLGPHALMGTVIGYFAGRWGEALVTDEHPLPPLIAGVLATLTMQIGRPVLEFIVEPASSLQGMWSAALIVTVVNGILAIPVYVAVRRTLLFAAAPSGFASAGEA